MEKFLLWKVFPVRCLRWILQFAVLECPPNTAPKMKDHNTRGLLEAVQRLLVVWSKREFVQSAPIEQQACILFFLFYSFYSFLFFYLYPSGPKVLTSLRVDQV